MNKVQWKIYYRLIRIARRESLKAATDAMIYGVGAVLVGDGDPRHIPYPHLLKKPFINIREELL